MSINTKADFDAIIERIKKLVENYENNVNHYNQYQFYIANGDRISFEITPQSIAHLLGIRLDFLRATGLFKNQNSYNLLKEFLDNSYSVYRQVQEGHLAYSTMFSEYLEEKLEAFEKIIYYFNPIDIEFVYKYDKSKSYQSGEEENYPCDYFLARKSKNGDMYLLGLVKQGNQYNPMTNITLVKDETQISKLKHLLVNQTLTYVNSMLIENPMTNYRNNPHMMITLKLEQTKKLKRYAGYTSGVSIDTSADFQYALNGYLLKDNRINTYKVMCQQLLKAIKEHEIFDIEQVEESIREQFDDKMIHLIQTYNDTLYKDSTNLSAQTSYTNLLEQYKILAIQVEQLKEKLHQSEQEVIGYQAHIQTLQAQDESYQLFQQQIFEVVEKQKQK